MYEAQKSAKDMKKKSVKNSISTKEKIEPRKKNWVRGSWIAYRRNSSELPPAPLNLVNL
jgi:hypothetical protein